MQWYNAWKLVWQPYLAPHTLAGGFLLLVLLAIYLAMLSLGCKLLTDGVELLMATKQHLVVSSVVVPVFAAIPECLLVLYSGWGGSDTETQIGTGLGALCGSTVMVLTLPWALCINSAGVDISEGRAKYPKNVLSPSLTSTQSLGLCDTGVEVDRPMLVSSAVALALTCSPYVLMEIPAFVYFDADDEVRAHAEAKWAAGLCALAFVGFFALLYFFWRPIPSLDQEEEAAAQRAAVQAELLRKGYPLELLATEFERFGAAEDHSEYSRLVEGSQRPRNNDLDMCLVPTFRKFACNDDAGGNKVLDSRQLLLAFRALGVHKTEEDLMQTLQLESAQLLSFPEFCEAVEKFLLSPPDHSHTSHLNDEISKSLWRAAAWPLGIGMLLVIVFTKPLIILLEELSHRSDISVFMFGYCLCPLATNITLLLSAHRMSEKRTLYMVTFANQQCLNTACVNNTVVLGIFLLLIYASNLYFDYSIAIAVLVGVELTMFLVALNKSVYYRSDALALLLVFPLSFVLIEVLEAL